MGRYCLNPLCRTRASYGFQSSNTASYCRSHAKNGMSNVVSKHCLRDSCRTVPSYNVDGSKTAAYCMQHAKDGMVNVRGRHCSHHSCTRRPNFNVLGGQTGVYCREHAKDGMVNVSKRRFIHVVCRTSTCFDVDGDNMKASYCRENAKDNSVDVRHPRCTHDSCMSQPSWGPLADGTPTTCAEHKVETLDSSVIKSQSGSQVAGRLMPSTCGLSGENPTRSRNHGSVNQTIACTTPFKRGDSTSGSSSYRSLRVPSWNVKTECDF